MSEEKIEKVNRLVTAMLEAEDGDRQAALANEVLQVNPTNPIAKYVKWQLADDEESMENLSLLQEAIDFVRPLVMDAQESVDDETYLLYVSMLSDLASFLYFKQDHDVALKIAEEFMDLDKEGCLDGRVAYYALLIEKGKYQDAVNAADEDFLEIPMSQYARAIALFEMEKDGDDAFDALLEAISIDPELSFMILGAFPFEENEMDEMMNDEDAYMEDLMIQASVLSDLWSASEERLMFLSAAVFTFGYLTDRINSPEELEMLEESYKKSGFLEELQEARDVLHAMIAEGKAQEDIDEEALLMFREMREKGIFS